MDSDNERSILLKGSKRTVIVYDARPIFRDRHDAGKRLAEELTKYAGKDTLVLGIARGGVPVGIEVAEKLGSDFDVIAPRKIPIPGNPEAGYGAVTENGTIVVNEQMAEYLRLTQMEIQRQAEAVKAEVRRRTALYRGSLSLPDMEDRTVIVVDDGLATGYTMLAAVDMARRGGAGKVVAVAPVAAAGAYEKLKSAADDVVCLVVARVSWFAVASFYYRWSDLSDAEVISYLQDWRREEGRSE